MRAILLTLLVGLSFSQKLLVPMDVVQTDHLKAYGIAFSTLEQNRNVDWLLNYRGGSFMMDANMRTQRECTIKGVYFELINAGQLSQIYASIEENNMDVVLLENLPKIAVYSPDDKQPWDDAVTLALTYAEIEYETVFDEEVLTGKLK